MIAVRNAKTDEHENVVATIVRAFSADPVARWMYPDPQQYCEYFPSFVKAFAGAAFEHGSADCIEGHPAAALWLPAGIHPDEEALVALVRRSVAERPRADVFELLHQMDSSHPAEPHWYLPMIGVDPEQQGRGYGSALLQHALARCDADGLLAYLESTSVESRRLYERHGFEVQGTIQVGSSHPLFPMVRKPNPSKLNRKISMLAGSTSTKPQASA